MSYKGVTILGFIVFLALSLSSVMSKGVVQQSFSGPFSTETFEISVYDASYGDYDDDNHVDDIKCFMKLEAFDNFSRNTFLLDIYLIDPAGAEYSYSLLVSTFYNGITFKLLFINHANVPGDYTIRVEANFHYQGTYYGACEIIFDPPTEQIPDDEPFLTYEVV